MSAKYCTCTNLVCWQGNYNSTNWPEVLWWCWYRHTLYLAARCSQYEFNRLICVLCHEYLKPSKVDTNVKLENGARCLHESGCGFSSATISAARSAGGMRCSNAFTQFNMLLEKSQHTWFGWAMQQQHSEGRRPSPTSQTHTNCNYHLSFFFILPEGELENYPGHTWVEPKVNKIVFWRPTTPSVTCQLKTTITT